MESPAVTAPTFCLVPGCTRPGIFERDRGRVCATHLSVGVLSRSEAEAFVGRHVPHGTHYRRAIVHDAARLLRGITSGLTDARSASVRAAALRVLREMRGETP